MKYSKFVLRWAIAGAGAPFLIILGADIFQRLPVYSNLEWYLMHVQYALWPSSIMMLAAFGASGTDEAIIFLISLLTNMVLYMVIGSIVWAVLSAHR